MEEEVSEEKLTPDLVPALSLSLEGWEQANHEGLVWVLAAILFPVKTPTFLLIWEAAVKGVCAESNSLPALLLTLLLRGKTESAQNKGLLLPQVGLWPVEEGERRGPHLRTYS